MAMFRPFRKQSAHDYDLLMPDAPAARPKTRAVTRQETIDADFVTVKETVFRDYGNDTRRTAYQQGKRRTVGALETFQAMIAWIDRKLSSLSVDGYSAVVAAAAVGMFFMSGGFSVLPTERQAVEAPPEPLAISHISITPQDAGGMEVLVINGIVDNRTDNIQEIPSIRADLFAAKGEKVASMLIEPPITEIGPGQSHGFLAKLRHPGGKTPEIKLSFIETDASAR